MSKKGLARLEILKKLNSDLSWVNKDIYRLFWNLDLLKYSLKALKINSKNDLLLDELIFSLKAEKFDFSKVIKEKRNIVIDIIKLILSSIYNNAISLDVVALSPVSFFEKISDSKFKNVFIFKFDLFLEKAHRLKFIELLERKIKDKKFINLINKLLNYYSFVNDNAFYFDELYLLFTSIYLFEFDLWLAKLNLQNKLNLFYARLGTTLILGVKEEAQRLDFIQHTCQEFLEKHLAVKKLEIVHSRKQKIQMLGFIVKYKNGIASVGLDLFFVQKYLRQKKICDNNYEPVSKASLVNLKKSAIASFYKKLYQSLLSYYYEKKGTKNFKKVFYMLEYSFYKTLAQKYKVSIKKISSESFI